MNCATCKHRLSNGDCELSLICPSYLTLRLMNLMHEAKNVKRNY